MPQAQSKETTDWSWVQADFCWSYIETAQSMEAAEKICSKSEIFSKHLCNHYRVSSKEQTEHHLNLEVFIYVVTQIMKQKTVKVEKVSATSVEK